MDNISTERLKKIYTKCSAIKQDFWNLYEKGYELAIPERNLYNNPAMGQRTKQRTILQLGQSFMTALLIYAKQCYATIYAWAELAAGEGFLSKLKTNSIQCGKVTRIGFEMVNASNFYVMMGENYQNLGIGTGTFIVHEGDDNTPYLFYCPS